MYILKGLVDRISRVTIHPFFLLVELLERSGKERQDQDQGKSK
jgi:hypothetical protein